MCGARHRVVRVLFRTRLRAGLRVVRTRLAQCFVCRQRVMSRASVRRLHAVVLGSSPSHYMRFPRVVRARSRVSARSSTHGRVVSCIVSSLRLESLALIKVLV